MYGGLGTSSSGARPAGMRQRPYSATPATRSMPGRGPLYMGGSRDGREAEGSIPQDLSGAIVGTGVGPSHPANISQSLSEQSPRPQHHPQQQSQAGSAAEGSVACEPVGQDAGMLVTGDTIICLLYSVDP